MNRKTMSYLSATLAIGITVILLLTGLPSAFTSGFVHSSNVRTEGNGFTWPFSYSTPSIPKSVGPQGIVGPTVALSAIGAPSIVGAIGKQGPVNESSPSRFHLISVTLTVTDHNGTVNSSVLALRQTVALQNLTYGQWISAKTGTTGIVNLTAPSGWYILYANASGAGFISQTREFYLPSIATSINTYMIPTSASVFAVNNGPIATRGTLFATGEASWNAGPMGHIEIQLLNASNGNAVIGTAYSLANGSVEFTGIDSAFSYQGNEVGWGTNAQDGVNYRMSNGGWGGFSITAAHTTSTTINNPEVGYSTTTGVLTGASLPTGGTNNRWNINSATVVTGGSTYLSAALQGASILTIVNGALYLNWTQEGYSGTTPIHLINSTVVVLAQEAGPGSEATLSPNSITAIHTRFFLQSNGPAGASGTLLGFISCKWCWIENAWQNSYSFTEGTLTNSTIANSTSVLLGSTNSDAQSGAFSSVWKWISVLNSTITGGGATKDFVVCFAFFNQTDILANRFASSFVNSSWIGSTSYQAWSQSDSSISIGGNSIWLHDTLTYTLSHGLSWTTWYHRVSSTSTSWSFADVNLSYVKVDTTQNGLTPIRNVALLSNHLRIYNSWLDSNYSLPTLIRLTQSGNMTSNVATSAILTINSNWWTWANYSLMDLGGEGYFATNGGNGTYTHDSWPWAWMGNAYNGFSLFGSVPPSGRWEHISLTNDSFGTVAYNSTIFYGFEKRLYGTIGLEWLFDTNFARQANPIGILNINYTVFHGTPIGPGVLFPAGDILQGVNGVTMFAGHDAFLNEPSSSAMLTAYQNGSFYHPPYAEDVISAGGITYLNDSWFVNLNNETVPYGGNAGAQASGSRPVLNLARDRFFYSPTIFQSSVDPNGATYSTQTLASPTDHWLSSIPTSSTATYQIPIDVNASLTSQTTANSFNVVSNFSRTETNGIPPSSWNTPNVYIWGIAPDVNASNGSLAFSYANGLEGGPQPKLYWHGFNYTSNVETLSIEIHVNSSIAPTAYADFSGLGSGTLYTLTTYYGSNGTAIKSSSITANSAGMFNVTFNPAVITDEIFTLTIVGGFFGFIGSPITFTTILILVLLALFVFGIVGLVTYRRKNGE